MNTAYSITALAFSFLAILVSVVSARRQTADVRRSNLMLYMTGRGEFVRSQAYREARDYIMTQLSQFDRVAFGVYGLPKPAIDYVLLAGGFYQDIGALVVTGVIEEDLAAALYYRGFREVWQALEPYIRGERELRRARGSGEFWGSFEHVAVYVNSVPHEKVRRKFLHRSFPFASARSVQPGIQPMTPLLRLLNVPICRMCHRRARWQLSYSCGRGSITVRQRVSLSVPITKSHTDHPFTRDLDGLRWRPGCRADRRLGCVWRGAAL